MSTTAEQRTHHQSSHLQILSSCWCSPFIQVGRDRVRHARVSTFSLARCSIANRYLSITSPFAFCVLRTFEGASRTFLSSRKYRAHHFPIHPCPTRQTQMAWRRHVRLTELPHLIFFFFPLCSFPPAAFVCNGISLCFQLRQICQDHGNATSCILAQVWGNRVANRRASVFLGQSRIFQANAVHANLELLRRTASSAFCAYLRWSV